jgi:predicted nucleic acid-binding Zn ribbon protein
MRPHSAPPSRYCIVCAKAIPRRVKTVEVRSKTAPFTGHAGTPVVDLRTIDDCRNYSGTEHVYALRLWHGYVYRFSTWDGKTWRDEFFCSNQCAIAQGYISARAGHRMARLSA